MPWQARSLVLALKAWRRISKSFRPLNISSNLCGVKFKILSPTFGLITGNLHLELLSHSNILPGNAWCIVAAEHWRAVFFGAMVWNDNRIRIFTKNCWTRWCKSLAFKLQRDSQQSWAEKTKTSCFKCWLLCVMCNVVAHVRLSSNKMELLYSLHFVLITVDEPRFVFLVKYARAMTMANQSVYVLTRNPTVFR